MQSPPLTIGSIAKRYGISPWKVRRVFERGLLPEPARVGAYRIIPPDDLPRIEEALRQCGYLPPEGGPHAA